MGYRGDGGDVGTLNISGGSVTGNAFEMQNDSVSTVNLTGGVLEVASIDLQELTDLSGFPDPSAVDPNTANVMDIAGGTLILRGDEMTSVNSHIESGRLIAYGGAGRVVASYDSVEDETTVTACSDKTVPDLTGDCAVKLDDFAVVAADWLWATPASQVWSFNMDADPVGTGDFDLKVRGDNANYTMTADSGRTVLELQDTGTTTLDQQYEGNVGTADTHVDYVIKSTNEYAVDLWIIMGTSAAEGRQSYVGISTMGEPNAIDPNVLDSQAVEIWDGTARQQGGTAAVSQTGFDIDAYITISVDYDYDTDTYTWSMSDGAGDTRTSASPVAYADTDDGDGGYFTLKSGKYGGANANEDEGTAYIDQLDITIDGTLPVFKAGDTDLDGNVDMVDLQAIADDWLTSD
jgi:hypothetical protein